MREPLIMIGDPSGILQMPKAPMRDPSDWSQMDSDTIAHLIQVTSQIQNSRWGRAKLQYTTQGERLLDHSLPGFEDFVFAAVYLRQLIAKKDSLLKDAVDRYCKFAVSNIRCAWVRTELDSFYNELDSEWHLLPGITVRELFDAFMYGAGLLHKFPDVGDSKRLRFLDAYDRKPRAQLLFALHGSLRSLMEPVSGIAIVIKRDYSHWLSDYHLPPPDTRWHSKLFDLGDQLRGEADSTDAT